MAFLQQIFPLHSSFLQREFGLTESESKKSSLPEIAMTTNQAYKIVIVGPDTGEKTSLAFQAGVSAASDGINVTYICTHPLKRLPAQVHGMPSPQPWSMKNVDFIYFEDCMELLDWFASVHRKPRQPGLIIVEDILTYATQLDENQLERSLARVCATILDAVMWIQSKSNTHQCSVLLTAPLRVMSLSSVLQQFSFKIAEYQGSVDDSHNSEISLREGNSVMKVNFKRHKETLVVKGVSIFDLVNT